MNVLVGLAGSDESIRTLRETIDRAIEAGDDLTVAVVEKDGASRTPEAMAEEAREICSEAGIAAEIETLSGHPGSELVDFAERGGFDRLVIGGGTESPMGKIRLGAVAEFVLLNAQTTVTLVR